MDNLSGAFKVTLNVDGHQIVFKLDLRSFNDCCASVAGTTKLECFNAERDTLKVSAYLP